MRLNVQVNALIKSLEAQSPILIASIICLRQRGLIVKFRTFKNELLNGTAMPSADTMRKAELLRLKR